MRLNDNTNENYLQVRLKYTPYILQLYNKTQMIDATTIKYSNTGTYLLTNWKIEANDKNGDGRIGQWLNSTKTNSFTSSS